ncbi:MULTISPECIES: hypothetical protein [Nocardiopsis]|uniref:Uncharacterized protein n=2 Tax=Nocardiopsis changdeensis TaxID=2831969 RepID=A0A975KQH9_9ACTN|nr:MULTISPECIES: hypothetical protein [Nocardiopsis]QUX26474.1 hypothetical protein KGD84_32770 [Nocardiopsis changdeensis]QYX40746.1 hypothetical protein K1J57_32620 [Nocardiopsis sp. MT53]
MTPDHQDNSEQGDTSMPAPAPPQAETDFVPFSTRVRQQTRRDVKAFAGSHGLRVQDVVETALREYLDRNA